MPLSWTDIKDAITLGEVVLAGAFAGFVFWLRASFATKSDHDALEKRMAAMEITVGNLASKEDVGRILQAIEQGNGERKALSAELAGVRRELDRLAAPLGLLIEHGLKGES
jgi:hypothetical protein